MLYNRNVLAIGVIFAKRKKVIVMQLKNVEPLSENVWLISAPDIQLSLDELGRLARKNAISYRTLEFDLESQWRDHPSPV